MLFMHVHLNNYLLKFVEHGSGSSSDAHDTPLVSKSCKLLLGERYHR